MANEEQLAILRQGAEVWNQWRWENPEVDNDLSEADLRGINLGSVDLGGAYLRKADLSGANLEKAKLILADLSEADFSESNLRGTNLISANLQGAYLWKVDLSGAILARANLSSAHLRRACLRKANLSRANLKEAKLILADLREADLHGADLYRVNLSRADLSGANLREAKLILADLSDANLSRADLSGASLKEAKLTQADLSDADLIEADLYRVNLSGSNLSRANLHGANLSRANLHGANLREANLGKANLNKADLSKTNLRTANLRTADLRKANLIEADLYGAILVEANLAGAHLMNSDLRGVNLWHADLSGANLSGVDLSGVDLSGINLFEANLTGANFTGVDLTDIGLSEDQRRQIEESFFRRREGEKGLIVRGNGKQQPPAREKAEPEQHKEAHQPTITLLGNFAASVVARRPEKVSFTAYHPKEAKVAVSQTLLVYTHVSSALATVREDAKRFQNQIKSPKETASKSSTPIARGTKLTIVPTCEGVAFTPKRISFKWTEDFHRADFRFKANRSLSGDAAKGSIDIYVGPLIVGTLKFAMLFDDKDTQSALEHEENASMYGRDDVFISYSRKDSEIVRTFKAVLEGTGLDVFIDMDDLKPGQLWDSEIKRRIESAKIFQIFWSANYSRSENCKREWEYALEQNRDEGYIRPVFWKKPISPKPPEELNKFNFKYVQLPNAAGLFISRVINKLPSIS